MPIPQQGAGGAVSVFRFYSEEFRKSDIQGKNDSQDNFFDTVFSGATCGAPSLPQGIAERRVDRERSKFITLLCCLTSLVARNYRHLDGTALPVETYRSATMSPMNVRSDGNILVLNTVGKRRTSGADAAAPVRLPNKHALLYCSGSRPLGRLSPLYTGAVFVVPRPHGPTF